MAKVVQRYRQLRYRYSRGRLLVRVLTKSVSALYGLYLRTLANYVYVYRFDPEAAPFPPPSHFSIRRFDSIQSISKADLDRLVGVFGETRIRADIRWIKHRGCTMWVGYIDGNPVCLRHTRSARAIPRWYVDLEADDVIFLRGYTVPEERGKGISPAFVHAIAAEYPTDRMHVYTDCSIHNHASIRSMAKAGYEFVAKRRSIKEPPPTDL